MSRLGCLRVLAATLVVAAVLTLHARPAAQDQTPTDRLRALLSDAQKAYTDHRLDDAARGFQALVDLAESQHDELWSARGRLGLGSVAYRRGDYTTARSRLAEVAPVFERLNASYELGLAEDLLGVLAEVTSEGKSTAGDHYKRAIAAFDKAGNRPARAYAQLNLVRSLDEGITPDSLNALTSLLDDAKSLGDRSLQGTVLHLWGDRLFVSGDFDGATDKLNDAVAVLEALPPSDELGTTYTSLGRIYRVHGQYQAAVQYQLKALAIHEKIGPPVSLVQSLNAVASSYATVLDVKHAKAYYERAIALAETAVSPQARGLLHANYASFLGFNGEPERGRAMLVEAMATMAPAQATWRYTELALIDHILHRDRDALADAEQAVAACPAAFTRFDCIRARQTRALTNLALGNDAAAIADHDAALAEIEDLHAHLAADDFLKQGFEDLWGPNYSLAIELHFRRGEIREALETAEHARSRALLDLLASRESRSSQTSPVLTTRGASPTSLRSDASAQSATLAGLTATAARLHSSLLLYWVADDKIYEWVVSPDGALSSASVSVSRSKLEDLVRSTSALGDDAPARGPTARTRGDQEVALVVKPRTAWRDLYDLLILPVTHYLPTSAGARLTIVPHGPLMNVPFAALRDQQGRYLIERYAVHSVTAGAMLEHVHARTADARSGSILLVADPAPTPKIPGDPPLPRLPGADAEVKAIARLLPADRTTVLADTAATEPRVLAAAGHQAVVHFATHAIVRDADPLGSFLALGRPADGSASGRLSADKIYKLALDANLVVLSACRSGEGVPTGDGIAALARAFFYAGSSSLIVSLWDIADEPTNRLLPAFYREWLKGADKARALRTAQLQLIADLRAGRVKVSTPLGDVVVPEDPEFWAAFILLGDPN